MWSELGDHPMVSRAGVDMKSHRNHKGIYWVKSKEHEMETVPCDVFQLLSKETHPQKQHSYPRTLALILGQEAGQEKEKKPTCKGKGIGMRKNKDCCWRRRTEFELLLRGRLGMCQSPCEDAKYTSVGCSPRDPWFISSNSRNINRLDESRQPALAGRCTGGSWEHVLN